jgi:hypothetical protein
VPSDLCQSNGTSPLTGLFLSRNALTGNLDVSSCLSLSVLELSWNNLSGTLKVPPLDSSKLQFLKADSNSFDMTPTLQGLTGSSNLISLSIANNQHDIASDSSLFTSRL